MYSLKKELKETRKELEELLNNTNDHDLIRDYNFYLYQLDSFLAKKDKNSKGFTSIEERLNYLKDTYESNKDLYQVLIDFNNKLINENIELSYIDDNLFKLYESFPKTKFSKKDVINYTRDFYRKLNPDFLRIYDKILQDKTVHLSSKKDKGFQACTIFVGGVNKAFIEIKREKNLTDFFSLVHETGHAINCMYCPKSYYIDNYFNEVASIFLELVSIYESNNILSRNAIVWENISNLLVYRKYAKNLSLHKDIVNEMNTNVPIELNKEFLNNIQQQYPNITKKVINTDLYNDGNYALSYIMALELLYLYKQDKKQTMDLFIELLYRLPLDNDLVEIGNYIKLNEHAYDECKEIIDDTIFTLKKTL